MLKRMNVLALALAVAGLLATGTIAGTAFAQKQAVPKPLDRIALGDDQTQQVSVSFVFDVDKNGQISRQDWLRLMATEFDKLDTNKSGQINAAQLTQSQAGVTPTEKFGK
jgi:hypothetical protein